MLSPVVGGRRAAVVAVAACIALMTSWMTAAVAQDTRYWDTNGPTPGAGGPTPSGTWSSAAANWSPNAAGDAATSAWVSGTGAGDGAVAFFSSGTDATGSFTVTIDGTNFASGMVVNQGTVNLAGAGFVGIGSGTVTVRPGTTLGINNQSRITQSAGGLLVLDGGTLLMSNTGNTGSLWTSSGAGILVTSNSGTVTPIMGNNITTYQGTFLGEGGTTTNGGAQTLTKTGTGELRVQGAQTANYTIAKLNILGGLYRIGSSTNSSGQQLSTETGFGAIPFGETPDAITLNGGAIGASTPISTDPFRGITLASSGGVINATAAALTLNGPITGAGVLRVIGNRGITFNGVNTATGGTIIGSDITMIGSITTTTGGTLTINTDSNLGAVPASPDPSNVRLGTATAGGTLIVAADGPINANRGITVGAAGGTISTTRTVTYGGVVAGSGTFTKAGLGGTLILTGSNTFAGGLATFGGGFVEVSSDANLGAVPATVKPDAITLANSGSSGRMRFTESFAMPATRGITINVGGTLGGYFEVAADKTLTIAGPITGGGQLRKTGSGALVLSGSSNYAGTTTVSTGTLVVNGVIGGTSAVSLSGGTTLAGSGTVNGPTTIGSFATVSPGASPGTLTFGGNLLWNSGGSYNWQMLSGTGTAGQTSAWDLITVGGTLDIGATSANPFAVNLWTLSSMLPDVSSSAAGFNPAQNYTWRIATAVGGITGFAADKFVIGVSSTNGTGGFANDLAGGTFSLAQSGSNLNLVFTANAPSVITINVPSGTQTQTQAGYPTLSGSIPVVKTGAGTLVLDQANTLSGSTTVQGGVLRLANG
ncbi:MAG: beta strand repeat-containing protein [Planctomycetaceae bacterium]